VITINKRLVNCKFFFLSSKLLAVLFTLLAVANAAELSCEYFYETYESNRYYECRASMITTMGDNFIERVSGNQLDGKTNDDVVQVNFKSSSMEVFPRNLKKVFPGLKGVSFADVSNLPNFKTEDFAEFSDLIIFYASGLPMWRSMPKDAFNGMPKLESLRLDRMTNLQNLDADLLVNNRGLMAFSAQGPNKINQISAGFFRNQDKLMIVDFRFTKLMRISYTEFENRPSLSVARFSMAGCLNRLYEADIVRELPTDIRKRCQDTTDSDEPNRIWKKFSSSSSSSSSSSESH
jgi:hypothetical protein